MSAKNVSVLMFPWLAHGHISPFFELAKKLSKRNFNVYIISTPVNLKSIKSKLSETDSDSVQLVELHLPILPDLPPHYHTTKGLPPHLMPTLKEAFNKASPTFYNILKTLKPDLLIYDFIQPWAPALASSLNIPAALFVCSSMAMTTFLFHRYKKLCDAYPSDAIYLHDYYKKKCEESVESPTDEGRFVDTFILHFERSCDVIFVKTFRELEGKYIDYLSAHLNKKVVPVGPLVQEPAIQENENAEALEWLDKRDPSSTVFVSFGSEFFLSKEEREAVAHGLEISEVNFIWVLRFPVGEKLKLEEALPKGFLERVQGRGLIVEDWAPQASILAHSSTGGFLCHCGWSSIMESMKFGVPIVALPMHIDQPLNARLVEDAGVGIEVRRSNNRDLTGEDIAKAIREVVMEKCGEDVRRKAREMSAYMRENADEEVDGVVEEILGLCGGKKNPLISLSTSGPLMLVKRLFMRLLRQ